MHNLDEETEERLEALLQQQISSVLTKINEQQEEEAYHSGGSAGIEGIAGN